MCPCYKNTKETTYLYLLGVSIALRMISFPLLTYSLILSSYGLGHVIYAENLKILGVKGITNQEKVLILYALFLNVLNPQAQYAYTRG